MDNKELEALAKQLHAVYWEAQGTISGVPTDWETINPKIREAWIQVAQFVATQSEDDIDRIMYSGYSPDHR